MLLVVLNDWAADTKDTAWGAVLSAASGLSQRRDRTARSLIYRFQPISDRTVRSKLTVQKLSRM